MRRLITRRHIGLVATGLLAVTLAVVAAVQTSGRAGSEAVDLALLRRTVSVATEGMTQPASPTPSPTPAATPTPTPTPMPTPTPTPTPAPVPAAAAPNPGSAPPGGSRPAYSQQQVESILTAAADAAGVDPAWLISTAECESDLNPYAYNASGPYDGVLQFLPSTFAAHGGTDIWDPTQQAQIAATMFASGESGEWPVCSR